MSNEGRHLTVRTAHRGTPVDTLREVSDPILEIVICDLHDVRFVLYDSDFRALGVFTCSIVQRIFWYDGVRVYDEDDLAHTKGLCIACLGQPLATSLLVRLLDGHLESALFDVVIIVVTSVRRRRVEFEDVFLDLE